MTDAKGPYDCVIIGAGISGLVCGCYLAKAGMKVLIAEQHFKPGGYCTSFRRNEFMFDAAAHSFGGCKEGTAARVLDDLGILQTISVTRSDPADIVTTPRGSVSFWADIERTLESFRSMFPHDGRSLQQFFSRMLYPDQFSLARTRHRTFLDLLNEHFSNEELKSVLAFPLFGNAGLPPSQLSAFIGAKIYREFLLDGGYHPKGGMQAFSEAFVARFKSFGGDLRLSCPVERIVTRNRNVAGVLLPQGAFVESPVVVSCADLSMTFSKLLGPDDLDPGFAATLSGMAPALSTFIVYLGLHSSDRPLPFPGSNQWFLPICDVDRIHALTLAADYGTAERYLLHTSRDERTATIFVNAPFLTRRFWEAEREVLADRLIRAVERHSVPNLSDRILFRGTAIPQTLQRYTLNREGSAYGWASTPEQLAIPGFRKPPWLRGLYCAGHWTCQGLGIPGVLYTGSATALQVLRSTLLKKGKKC